jgi:hypothetical protein
VPKVRNQQGEVGILNVTGDVCCRISEFCFCIRSSAFARLTPCFTFNKEVTG